MTIQITILGLEQIGASIGLALAGKTEQLLRVGNDRSNGVARQAEKMGAIDKIQHNLPSAVAQADLVILALPVDEIQDTIKVIAQDLKPGAVVIDTSPVKVVTTAWARAALPEERYFVAFTAGLNPDYLAETVSGIDAAHADLFQNSLIFITVPPNTNPDAVKLATDLASLLGATPLFADPYESDGLIAASHTLPKLMAAALLNSTTGQPGWIEGRKLAGRDYARATDPAVNLDERKQLGQSALLNRDNVLRAMDNFSEAWHALREAIASDNAESLTGLLTKAQEERMAWWKARSTLRWDRPEERTQLPSSGQMLGRLVGLRPKGLDKGDKKKK